MKFRALTQTDRWAIWFTLGLIASCLFLSSCSPQQRLNRKIQRAERFAKKHELLIMDTITYHDTIVIERSQHDTITEIRYNDSVTVINNERVRLVYHVDSVTREIHHEVECKEQTITREIKIPTERIIHKETIPKWQKWGILILLLILLIAAIKNLIKR